MAQLADDCFAFGGRLIPLEEALESARSLFPPIDQSQTLPLTAALGRVAAETIQASRAVPPHDNSAVDGYAVRHVDLNTSEETFLPLNGYAAAGDTPATFAPRNRATHPHRCRHAPRRGYSIHGRRR